MALQEVFNVLSKYTGDREQVNYTAARPYFRKVVFRSRTQCTEAVNDSSTTVYNQLRKETIHDHHDRVLRVLDDWAEQKPCRVWMSDTLSLDFGLPGSLKCSALQTLVLCQENPPIVLTLYDTSSTSDETEKETQLRRTARETSAETAEHLSSALLNFCHHDFVLLPCALPRGSITRTGLEKEIEDRLNYVTRFYGGPEKLSPSAFTDLHRAATAVAGVTNVPALLNHDPHSSWLLLLESDWRNALSLLTELLGRKDEGIITCSRLLTYREESGFKVKVAVVEAAKRLSIQRDVAIVTSDEKIRSCARRMVEQSEKDEDVELKLKVMEPDEHQPPAGHLTIYIDYYCPKATLPVPSLCVDKKEIRLLLFGRTGGGRSTTGNTILEKEVFPSSAAVSFGSLTVTCEAQSKETNEVLFEVMDSPGLHDTHRQEEDVMICVRKAAEEAENGFDAILYVVKIGTYTQEEQGVYRRLKAILGDDVKNYVIVVFTHGDLLEEDLSDTEDIPEDLRDVLKDCNGRYIVFNNFADDKSPQIESLLEKVRIMRSQNGSRPFRCLPTTDEETKKKLTEIKNAEKRYERSVKALLQENRHRRTGFSKGPDFAFWFQMFIRWLLPMIVAMAAGGSTLPSNPYPPPGNSKHGSH